MKTLSRRILSLLFLDGIPFMPYVGRMPSQHCPLYHYRVKDKVVGPVSLADLHVLLTSKKIPPDTMIREEHCQTWMPLTGGIPPPGAPGPPPDVGRPAGLPSSEKQFPVLRHCPVQHGLRYCSLRDGELLPVHGSGVPAFHSVFHGQNAGIQHLLTGGIRKIPIDTPGPLKTPRYFHTPHVLFCETECVAYPTP